MWPRGERVNAGIRVVRPWLVEEAAKVERQLQVARRHRYVVAAVPLAARTGGLGHLCACCFCCLDDQFFDSDLQAGLNRNAAEVGLRRLASLRWSLASVSHSNHHLSTYKSSRETGVSQSRERKP